VGVASSRWHVLVSSFPPPPPQPAALFPVPTCYNFLNSTLSFITSSLFILQTRKNFTLVMALCFDLILLTFPIWRRPPPPTPLSPPFPLTRRNFFLLIYHSSHSLLPMVKQQFFHFSLCVVFGGIYVNFT
jgi:hypothetical protein